MDEIAKGLEGKGERVYKIPLGASNEVGSLGMVAAMEEIGIQQLELGEQFDAIVLASSSGGTQAGLEVGKRLFGYKLPARVTYCRRGLFKETDRVLFWHTGGVMTLF